MDASDRKQVRAAEKRAKLAETQRREIVAGIMSLAPGRAWMYDILAACHIFETSFNDSPSRMAFSEGERNVGLRHLSDIMSFCADQYVQMTREANERHTSSERPSLTDTDGGDQGSDPDDSGDPADA